MSQGVEIDVLPVLDHGLDGDGVRQFPAMMKNQEFVAAPSQDCLETVSVGSLPGAITTLAVGLEMFFLTYSRVLRSLLRPKFWWAAVKIVSLFSFVSFK